MQAVAKKRMLYIMGIDWEWIYQRPQVIAEYLSQDYEITVAFPVKIWGRRVIKKHRKQNPEIHKLKLWVFPFQRKSKWIGKIAGRYKKFLLRNCRQYEYIYIDDPIAVEYILEEYKGCLIYDCIDDHAQMCGNEYMRRKVETDEEILMQRSDLLIFSSQNLLKKKAHICNKNRLNLVRNGTNYTIVYEAKESVVKNRYIIGYIGTIAEWFDQKLIIQSVQKYDELEYHLVGPCMISEQVRNNRIIYDGVMEHENLHLHVKEYDCMIMPFIVNEIVKAVDPVKLYEYIAFGKCIICVYYEELEYFRDYVYFYKTEKEYNSLLENLIKQGFPPKYNRQQQEKFLKENSWKERYQIIHQLIEQISSHM